MNSLSSQHGQLNSENTGRFAGNFVKTRASESGTVNVSLLPVIFTRVSLFAGTINARLTQ